jgi:hypothetical protein
MIEAYYDKSISQPYASLITKLLKHIKLSIPSSKPTQHLKGTFEKVLSKSPKCSIIY